MKTINTATCNLLFVYGALRRGESNDINQHKPEPRLIGYGRVRGRLYDLGDCPGVILDPTAGYVTGEIYAIEPWLVPILDAVEDNCGEYFRLKATVQMEDGGELTCMLYESGVREIRGRSLIEGGDWVAHRFALRVA